MYIERVSRINNTIVINSLNHPICVSNFLRKVYDGIKKGYTDFFVTANLNTDTVFPNACVPIAGIIDYYKCRNINFSYCIDPNHYLNKCHFYNPMELKASEIRTLSTPFDILFRYTESSQVAALTQAYIDALSRLVQCNQGVIDGIIWCINEVMDNVLIHSETNSGFVMSQYHPNTNHISFCVYDAGIGIYNSLKESKYHPHTHLDAISLSMQEGIGDGLGQGNGLFGLNRIVESNGGSLTITTGPASLMIRKSGERKTFKRLPFLNYDYNGTTVDFQLDITKEINIKEAFESIGGFDGFDIRLDDMLQENDLYLYDVLNNCEGTATREAGLHIRNDVINIICRTSSPIILDFSKVTSVSSSFIDEFVSKLIVHFGIISFNQMIRIIGMNSTIKHLLERSTYMRIHSMWEEKDKPKVLSDDISNL